MKDAILFLILAGSIIFVVRLLHFLLGRFGFYDWLATWLWNTSKKEGDVFWRMSEWMSNHSLFWEKPAAPASAPASAGTRAAKPQSGTHVLVWVCLTFLALSNIYLAYIVPNLQRGQRALTAEVVSMRTQLVPQAALTTGMLAEPVEAANLATRLIRDFDETSRRLEAIAEEPALDLSAYEVDFLRGNDLTLERMITLASLTDTDQDGVMNADDSWPTIPRGQFVVERSEVDGVSGGWMEYGIPMADTDEDGIRDAVDACPMEAGPNYDLRTVGGIPQKGGTLIKMIPVAFYGCPDGDSDLIPDAVDVCPEAMADYDQNFDGCEDEEQNFSQGVVDYRYVTEKPAYGDSSGKLVGRFTAERTVGDVVVEFLIACEAMGADGTQLPGDTTDYNLVKKWGVCRPVGNV